MIYHFGLLVLIDLPKQILNNIAQREIFDVSNKYNDEVEQDKILESDDVYYSRNIPRDSLLSLHMLNFHNQAIKKKLYEYSKDRNSLLELCGGEGGDMNRWVEYNYSFILAKCECN